MNEYKFYKLLQLLDWKQFIIIISFNVAELIASSHLIVLCNITFHLRIALYFIFVISIESSKWKYCATSNNIMLLDSFFFLIICNLTG